MRKPTKKNLVDRHYILDEDWLKLKDSKNVLLRRKVKRASPGKGKLVSELIIEMRC
jgi:hypothetical protein